MVSVAVCVPVLSSAQGVIHTFKQPSMGVNPYLGLIADAAGNLYGVTPQGGYNLGPCLHSGCGTAFKITPDGGGGYTFSVVYAFKGGAGGSPTADAANPSAPLTVDSAGNLYGTSGNGGFSGDQGTAFEISPLAGGGYAEKVLYSFGASPTDSAGPQGLVPDSAGNLYGTAAYGGRYGHGTVYELSPDGTGGWTEKILYSFTGGNDGGFPYSPAPMIWDSAGNLYGTTNAYGVYGQGVVFELSPVGDGTWTEKALYSFSGGRGGCSPGSIVFDPAGDIFGIAGCGGNGYLGMMFELTEAAGVWTLNTVHRFSATDGDTPSAAPTDAGSASVPVPRPSV
jgi:uncharacterized repeat protein (TIGR03803 family)